MFKNLKELAKFLLGVIPGDSIGHSSFLLSGVEITLPWIKFTSILNAAIVLFDAIVAILLIMVRLDKKVK